MKEAVINTDPAPAATGSCSTEGSGRTSANRRAGPSPSAIEGQKRSPYSRIVSAISWPIVRSAGGIDGGGGLRGT
jgi:hypothetical protein